MAASRIRSTSGRVAGALGAAGLLGLLGPACSTLPGTILGTYQVTATGQTNTCGLGAPATYEFDVELSRQQTTLYWSWLENQPIASGVLTPVAGSTGELQVTLTSMESENVDASDAGPGPCTMERADSLAVTLAAGSPPGTFTGTMSYAFSAETGADCTDQLVASGGMYSVLPCTVSYTIAGKLQ